MKAAWYRRIVWWLRTQDVADPCLEALIQPPRQIFAGADESLPVQAERRRQHAASKKLDAARITSAGESHDSKLIRIVR